MKYKNLRINVQVAYISGSNRYILFTSTPNYVPKATQEYQVRITNNQVVTLPIVTGTVIIK